jgi:hypothetical protein
MLTVMNNTIRHGTSFAITIAIAYTLCTAAFWIWPQAAASFMNGLFHGLDFTKLQSGSTLFNFGSFIVALMGVTAWAFAVGTLFGWISARLANAR